MGQDIHLWIEYRRAEDQPWTILRQVVCETCGGHGDVERTSMDEDQVASIASEECWRCDGSGVDKLHEDVDEYDGKEIRRLTGGCAYRGRNYRLFAALANSGRITSREAVVEERGVPDDGSPEYLRIVEEWGDGGHTHSWLDLDDLIAVMAAELQTPYEGDHMSEFKRTTFALVQRIAAKRGHKNVRVVFFFDN